MSELDVKTIVPVYNNTPLKQGSGPLLAFRLTLMALQSLQKKDMPLLVVSGKAIEIAMCVPVDFYPTDFPGASARALSYFSPVVVFADEESTRNSIPSISLATENLAEQSSARSQKALLSEDILYINYTEKESSFAHIFNASYTATACTAHPEDYIIKIRRALAIQGFRYIEVFCPDPSAGFDPSNAVEVGRLAVETGVWPVFEYINSELKITKQPLRLEPLERYTNLQKKFSRLSAEELAKWQEKINRRWKFLREGKLVP